MTEHILVEQKKSIRLITLNRPKRLNAINSDLINRLAEELTKANADDNTRVIILLGAGRAFCTGNDMTDSAVLFERGYSPKHAKLDAEQLQEITRQIFSSQKIVIAAIQGWAVGAGFEWTINCDFTIWGEDAKAFFPEVSFGLFATGGVMSLLAKTVGIAKAREMLLFGQKYTAQQLSDMGLTSRVTSNTELLPTALALAKQIISLPKEAVYRFKKTFNQSVYFDLEQTLNAEVSALVDGITSPETRTLINAHNKIDI